MQQCLSCTWYLELELPISFRGEADDGKAEVTCCMTCETKREEQTRVSLSSTRLSKWDGEDSWFALVR